MLFNVRQWFISSSKEDRVKQSARKSGAKVQYEKLPKNLHELDDGYKSMLRELSKR